MENKDILIGKFLAGECSAAEQIALEKWLNEKPENRDYFESLEKIWKNAELSDALKLDKNEVETALQKTKNRIQQKQNPTKLRVSFGFLARAAAAVLVLAAAWWLLRPDPVQRTEFAATELPKTDTLTDGSVVALNANSQISAQFSSKKRSISLQGEAYFEVAADKEKPFVVQVQDLEIEVVGTRFNVDNRSDRDKISVEVTEGKVKLESGTQRIFLVAGEKAIFQRLSGQFEKVALDQHPNVRAWVDKKFVFDETPLKTVIAQLEKVYGVEILLKNKSLENCPVYVVFEGQNIERIIEILAETFSLTVEKNGNAYLLNGKNCAE